MKITNILFLVASLAITTSARPTRGQGSVAVQPAGGSGQQGGGLVKQGGGSNQQGGGSGQQGGGSSQQSGGSGQPAANAGHQSGGEGETQNCFKISIKSESDCKTHEGFAWVQNPLRNKEECMGPCSATYLAAHPKAKPQADAGALAPAADAPASAAGANKPAKAVKPSKF